MSRREKKSSSRKEKSKTQNKVPSSKVSSLSPHDSSPKRADISIRIHNFENLDFLLDDGSEEFEIVAKYLGERINSVDFSRISERNKNSFEIVFGIQVNVSSEEAIFDICSNPLSLSLLKHTAEKEAVTLGHCNVDMFALCTPFVESITYRKHFERETSHFRKISFDCQISSDIAMLKENYGNVLYVTIDSVHNFEAFDKITVGFKAPMNSQVTQKKFSSCVPFIFKGKLGCKVVFL